MLSQSATQLLLTRTSHGGAPAVQADVATATLAELAMVSDVFTAAWGAKRRVALMGAEALTVRMLFVGVGSRGNHVLLSRRVRQKLATQAVGVHLTYTDGMTTTTVRRWADVAKLVRETEAERNAPAGVQRRQRAAQAAANPPRSTHHTRLVELDTWVRGLAEEESQVAAERLALRGDPPTVARPFHAFVVALKSDVGRVMHHRAWLRTLPPAVYDAVKAAAMGMGGGVPLAPEEAAAYNDELVVAAEAAAAGATAAAAADRRRAR